MKKVPVLLLLILGSLLYSQEESDNIPDEVQGILILWRDSTEILPEDIRLSSLLYEKASDIFSTATNDKKVEILTEALDLLYHSLKYNPDNERAWKLIQEIREQSSRLELLYWPPFIQEEYNKAENEYFNGNIIKAYTIIKNYEENVIMLSYPPFRELRQLVYKNLALIKDN